MMKIVHDAEQDANKSEVQDIKKRSYVKTGNYVNKRKKTADE